MALNKNDYPYILTQLVWSRKFWIEQDCWWWKICLPGDIWNLS